VWILGESLDIFCIIYLKICVIFIRVIFRIDGNSITDIDGIITIIITILVLFLWDYRHIVIKLYIVLKR